MADPIKVTVSDPGTGEVLEERVLDDDYLVLCAGNRYLDSVQAHANGTHVLTVKREVRDERSRHERAC
jgi:hypothetical protein